MTAIRLKGRDTNLVITTNDWNEMLDLAEEFGWRLEQVRSIYRADVGLRITASDSGNMAIAFEKLGDHNTEHEPTLTEAQRNKMLDDLSKLIAFCRSGQFRMC